MSRSHLRPAWAEVDLDAVRHNAGLLARLSSPARLCAVVKADAYGHGAVPVARAALEGGATSLAVALVEEGLDLRRAGIDAPVLLLSEPDRDAMAEAASHRLTPTLYTEDGVRAAIAAARHVPGDGPLGVQVKVDTGMHRVGADPKDATAIAGVVHEAAELDLAGVWTHLAVAEDVDDAFTDEQLRRFACVVEQLRSAGVNPGTLHAANSAGAISRAHSRLDMVRCGIALYGYAPSEPVESSLARQDGSLRPVLSLKARVSLVRHLDAGERISYGRRYELRAPSAVATVPIGYADGVQRRLFGAGAHVLLGGVRRPIAGSVTMDQIVVDCGPGADVSVGDEVVLLGEQGGERIGADEWARLLDTISYEVLCGIGPRVPRLMTGERGHAASGQGLAGGDQGPTASQDRAGGDRAAPVADRT